MHESSDAPLWIFRMPRWAQATALAVGAPALVYLHVLALTAG